jgi:predicted nucleic acid-binding protein
LRDQKKIFLWRNEDKMSVLVDTTIWINHFRKGSKELIRLLDEDEIVIHSIIIGELSTGNLPKRKQTLKDLYNLQKVDVGSAEEVLQFIESERLYGKGVRWGDCNLLYSAIVNAVPLWTEDVRFSNIARRYKCRYLPG